MCAGGLGDGAVDQLGPLIDLSLVVLLAVSGETAFVTIRDNWRVVIVVDVLAAYADTQSTGLGPLFLN